MKFKISILLLCLFVICACKSDKAHKDTPNTETEVVKSNPNPTIELSTALLKNGLKLNNSLIKNSPTGGHNNLLSLQLMFEDDFEGIIYVKVLDMTDGKSKRAKLQIKGAKGRVDTYDFTFAKDIQIDSNGLILVE
jgi:hypothetical protein